ncbi:alpha/beta fold hydrolase [Abyssisolibacter fermentans]|uniref:alpha/beta fold hydrolase n=1 Tax=Abyssisolibacter fermentans TaxID=1766203 RepID=UPI000831C368|nr:alpha/beta hydrolase [Abyssisolibacter fermentans]
MSNNYKIHNETASINESEMVNIGGVDQYVLVRGKRIDNPIMLFLHGGPGAPLSPIAFHFPSDIEENFLVAHWDQRGAGKSYHDNISKESINEEQFIEDTIEVVDYLISKYNKEKIYLLGLSWGSLLGINAVHRYPEKFYAYIASGQIVDAQEGLKVAYQALLDEAKRQNNVEAIKELEQIGDVPRKNSDDNLVQLKWVRQFGFGERNTSHLYEESCSDEEMQRIVQGVEFTCNHMSDLFKLSVNHIKEIKVPVYFCSGRDDYQTPSLVVKKYCEKLIAPKKDFIWFENSAHAPICDEPEKFKDVLLEILKETN